MFWDGFGMGLVSWFWDGFGLLVLRWFWSPGFEMFWVTLPDLHE